ncbi:hypothetical protein [Bacillus sp. AFS017336]|uniref:hypothetical protein n=1 Tax=Bacillus sp. AFS017336 TaxID=2033489 RepID=UPI000BF07158|nr:hypothetical protein [Bacillus sp. AFS017336]PEL12887.1 hypothetical protein CN601_06390 [Bacillus sp. AFS017336]
MGFNFVKGEQNVDFVDIVVNFVDIMVNFVDIVTKFIDILMNLVDIVANFIDILLNLIDIVANFVDILLNLVDIVANSFDIVLKSFSELNTDGFFALFMVLLDYILAFGCFSINFIGFSSILLFFHSISS